MAFIPNTISLTRPSVSSPWQSVRTSPGAQPELKRVEVPAQNANVLREARALVGTTFQLNARSGASTDCGGMMIEIAKRLDLFWLDLDRHYDLANCGGQALYVHMRSCMNEISPADMLPGDVVLLSIKHADYPQHLAVFAGKTIVHSNPAMATRSIVEQDFSEAWIKRIYASFRFRPSRVVKSTHSTLHPHVPCEKCVLENPDKYTKRFPVRFHKTCAH